MISINATIFMQAIHFLLLIFILNRIMFKPILKIIEGRKQYIDQTISKMANIEEETAGLIEKYSSMERAAIKEAGNESSRLKKEAMDVSEKIFTETRDEINSIRERVGKEIETKIIKARQSLEDEAKNLADIITEKLTGRRVKS